MLREGIFAGFDVNGSRELKLPVNQKLEGITWKDDTLCYLVRPMREDEEAETHIFQAFSAWGISLGAVTIIEKKEDVIK